MPSLFISYRRSDSPDTVKLIYERLKKRLPRWEIFYDHESIPLGDPFPERLRTKVTSATIVLVIIGPRWLQILHERKSAAIDHVREEVRLALESAMSIVPVLVSHAVMPTETDLADLADLAPLLIRNGRPVRPDPDFDGDLAPIIAHIRHFDSDEAIGSTLADKYTLTAEIGHGGMGVVYRAEQKQPVKRTVAVKLINPGMDTREVLARFDAERQALAVMDHPNIAKVHDAGKTAQGRPFFVMEFVKGVPITQYCDDKKLTPQERLNLFIPVCNAVQHAHQKGIIHRDIKPSNVLVEVIDGRPVAKVIDFGLAKALGQKLTDKTLYTDMNMRVGTLEYSAPEQAAGRSFDVDTRSDIYSLGVLLYELLTGAPPFTHEELLKIGEEEMRRVIREKEPAKPSKKLSSSGELPAIAANRHLEPKKLTRLVQGDLDWIVMKCLEKEQARRYETANQLGQELQRFLADEPVQAGPPSVVYRLRKFTRRNREALLTTAGVLLATVLGVAIAFWRINIALDGEKKANLLAAERLEIVEQQKRDIQKALDCLKEEEQLVRKEQENTAAALFKSRVAEQLALLKTAETRNAKTAAQIDHEAIWVHIQLGDKFLDVYGATAKARKEYDLARSLAAQLVEADKSNAVAQRDLSASFDRVGAVQLRLGETAAALESHRRALGIHQKLADDDRGNAQAQRDLSVSFNNVGDVQLQLGETAAALKSYRRALEMSQKLADADQGNAQAQRDLSISFNRVGDVQLQLGETAAALKSYHRALEISQKLADANKGNGQVQLDLLVSFYKIGKIAEKERSYREAAQWYRKGLDVAKRFARPDFFAKEAAFLTDRLTFCAAAEKAVADLDFALEQTPDLVPQLLVARFLVWRQKGKHAEVAATAAKLRALADLPKTTPGTNLYNAACGYALASTCPDTEEKTKEAHAAKSVLLLKEAREKGYFKTKGQVEAAKKDADLDPLRQRGDFKALLAELEKDAK